LSWIGLVLLSVNVADAAVPPNSCGLPQSIENTVVAVVVRLNKPNVPWYITYTTTTTLLLIGAGETTKTGPEGMMK
jgi:hypothetical protein